jgi:hypothetical protein
VRRQARIDLGPRHRKVARRLPARPVGSNSLGHIAPRDAGQWLRKHHAFESSDSRVHVNECRLQKSVRSIFLACVEGSREATLDDGK